MLWNGQITLAFLVKYGKINNIKFNKNCGRAKACLKEPGENPGQSISTV